MSWRSLLFVPVLEERFVAKAAERGADAVVLDLEASIDPARKGEARAALAGAVARLSGRVDVTVRINPCWVPAMRDLEASVIAGVSAIQLPLCETPAQALAVAGAIGELEAERGLEPGAIGLIAMLESAGAVIRAPQIAAATPRLAALTLGVEDYAASMGAEASHALLRPAAQQVTQAARAADIASYAVAAGMSDFRDVEALRSAAQEARALGATGGYAVHPAQVAILNAVFAPTEAEIDWARRALAGAEAAAQDGRGVFVLDGRMIDLPLVKRARAILKTAAVSKGKHQS